MAASRPSLMAMRLPSPAPSSSKTAISSAGSAGRPGRSSQLSGTTSFQRATGYAGVAAVEGHGADHVADSHVSIPIAFPANHRLDRGRTPRRQNSPSICFH